MQQWQRCIAGCSWEFPLHCCFARCSGNTGNQAEAHLEHIIKDLPDQVAVGLSIQQVGIVLQYNLSAGPSKAMLQDSMLVEGSTNCNNSKEVCQADTSTTSPSPILCWGVNIQALAAAR